MALIEEEKYALFPMGIPEPSGSYDGCVKLLLHAGVGAKRLVVAPKRDMDAYVNTLTRQAASMLGSSRYRRIFVVMTVKDPEGIERALHERRELEERIRVLTRAQWILFSEPGTPPEFVRRARAIGEFNNDDLDRFPIWVASDRWYFLFLTPTSVDRPRFLHHVELLWGYIEAKDKGVKTSGFVRRPSVPRMVADPSKPRKA